MSAATMQSTQTTSKPATRSRASLRQTLTLASASMGKALADAIHKDHSSDRERVTKKTKEKEAKEDRSARRASTIASRPAAPRASLSVASPEAPASKPDEAMTMARRVTRSQKLVVTSSEDSGNTSVSASVRTSETRTSEGSFAPSSVSGTTDKPNGRSLRPRTAAGSAVTASALPKYRPRSTLIEPSTASAGISAKNVSSNLLDPSPVHPPHRRKLSADSGSSTDDASVSAATDRSTRPISPLPRRAALKPISSAINAPASGSTRHKDGASAIPRSVSPVRQPAAKTQKKSAAGAAIARPSSAASMSAASISGVRLAQAKAGPSTPRSLKDVFGMVRGTPPQSGSKRVEQSATPGVKVHKSTIAVETPPVQRPPRSARPAPASAGARSEVASVRSDGSTPTATPSGAADATADSIDVELMLAPVTSAGPTPAMPRILLGPQYADPSTPSRRPGADPSLHMSHLIFTPEGPTNGDSPARLRPSPGRAIPHDPRSVTWEQLADSGSRSLGFESANLLTDMHVPFLPMMSPLPSTSQLTPDSPHFSTSALPSPLSQSISNVLLPTVTPSIVPRRELFPMGPALGELPRHGMSSGPSPDTVMLRLQLAKADSDARERLAGIQQLETQLAASRDMHARELHTRDAQLAVLEAQLERALDSSARMNDLTDALAQAEARRAQDVDAARASGARDAHKAQVQGLARERTRWRAAQIADAAAARWAMVMDGAEAELTFVENAKETLAVLRSSLACLQTSCT